VTRYAAFLRAVNLGSTRKVSSAQLKEIFEAMGFEDATAFRTSGNVAFAAAEEADLTARIETALRERLGFEVPVYVRSEKEMLALAEHEPFPAALVGASKGKLQVMFLGGKPGKRARDEVLSLASEEDRLAFGDRELYWLPSGGTQKSKLDSKAVDELVGPLTMRTKGTIEQMAAKFFAN
jgi:uncharacterized protein (DUF1697 family)